MSMKLGGTKEEVYEPWPSVSPTSGRRRLFPEYDEVQFTLSEAELSRITAFSMTFDSLKGSIDVFDTFSSNMSSVLESVTILAEAESQT